jgi:hypothetical protein
MADALSMLHRKQRSYSSLHSLRHIRSRTTSSGSAAEFPAAQVVKVPPQPKRTLHVVNGFASPGINSPPPAYDTTDRPQFSPDHKDPTIFQQSPPESHSRNESASSSSVISNTSTNSKLLGGKKLGSIPPRLSLHDNSGDLSNWSEALLSSIPTEVSFAENQSNSAESQSFSPSQLSTSSPSPPDSQVNTARPRRRGSSSHSVPSIILREYEDDETSQPPGTARSPLWDELMGMVQEASPGMSMNGPALNEALSPTLPNSPSEGERRFKIDSQVRDAAKRDSVQEEERDVENDERLLSVEDRERGSNRDSGASSVSTATVTAATIVQTVSVAKRATANFFDPLMGRTDDDRKTGSSVGSSSMLRSSLNLDSPRSSNFDGSNDSSASSSLPSEHHNGQVGYPEVDVNYPAQSPVYLEFLESPPLPDKEEFGREVLSRAGTFGMGTPDKTDPDELLKLQTTIVNGM